MTLRILSTACFFFVLVPSAFSVERRVASEVERYLDTWEINKAMRVLQEIPREQNSDPEYWKLLALVYFYQGEYREAKKYGERAVSLDPDNKELEKLVSFIDGTLKITSEMGTYSSPHFLLRVGEVDSILVDYALPCLETAYNFLEKEFRFSPQDKIVVEVYPTTEGFIHASGLSQKQIEVSGAVGICKFNHIMILSPRLLLFGYRWLDALVHELTHYFVVRIAGLDIPLWLNEGLAKYYETKWRQENGKILTPFCSTLLARAIREKRWIDFQKMRAGMPTLESREEVTIAFGEVVLAVEYIIAKYGKENLIEFIHRLGFIAHAEQAKKKDQEAAFEEFFHTNEEAFELALKNFLAEVGLEEIAGMAVERFILLKEKKEMDELDNYLGWQAKRYARLGDLYFRNRRFTVALVEYQKGLRNEPNNHIILNRIAKTYASLGEMDKAEEFFRKSLLIEPNYGPTYTGLARLYFAQGKWKEALEKYNQSIQINPFDPEIHKNMGVIYLELGQVDQAKGEWTIAQKLSPEDLEVASWLLKIQEIHP